MMEFDHDTPISRLPTVLGRVYGQPLPAEVKAAIEGVARELRQADDRAAGLLVDADRREKRAFDMAHDCEWHGQEIAELEGSVMRFWRDNAHLEQIRFGLVAQLILLSSEPDKPAGLNLDHLSEADRRFAEKINRRARGNLNAEEPVEMTADELRRRMRAIIDQQPKALDVLHKKSFKTGCPSCPHCRAEDAAGSAPASVPAPPKHKPRSRRAAADSEASLFDEEAS